MSDECDLLIDHIGFPSFSSFNESTNQTGSTKVFNLFLDESWIEHMLKIRSLRKYSFEVLRMFICMKSQKHRRKS